MSSSSIFALVPTHKLLIHPQADFYSFQLVIHIEDYIPSLSPFPVLPKEPISFQSNNPVLRATPPCLHDPNKIIGLQAYTHLNHLVCSSYCASLCTSTLEGKKQRVWFIDGIGGFLHNDTF